MSTIDTRRDLRIEAHFLPETVDDLVELRQAILEAGHSESVAHGIVGWVVGKGAGETDALGSRTRSTYRKILAELVEQHPDGPTGRQRRDQAGFAHLRHLLGLGAASAAAAYALATPIIHEESGYVMEPMAA